MLVASLALAQSQAPIGEVFTADSSVSGSVLYAGSGTPVLSGSQVAAGGRSAVLKLTRGGEIRICPNTSVAVSASPNGRNLLFSLNEGTVEFHFDITSENDALQTPDFRIQFAGPGRFDMAMCTDKQGDRSVRCNTNSRAAIIVNEMMGDGVYQVPAGQSLDFHSGTVQDPVAGLRRCGCPEQEIVPQPNQVVTAQTPAANPQPVEPAPVPPQPAPTAATLPPSVETHLQVDAPFVYQGDDFKPESERLIAKLQTVSAIDAGAKLTPTVTPPTEKPAMATGPEPRPVKKKSGGFFKKIGSFFGKMFKG